MGKLVCSFFVFGNYLTRCLDFLLLVGRSLHCSKSLNSILSFVIHNLLTGICNPCVHCIVMLFIKTKLLAQIQNVNDMENFSGKM